MSSGRSSKDIVVIVNGGGMACIFATGVLEVIDEKLRDRVRSVYATSAGAHISVYFVAGQTWFPHRYFLKYLTRKGFVPGHIIPYLYKVFVLKGRSTSIPDYLDIDYPIDTAQASECPLDLSAFESSKIDFFVKVLNIRNSEVSYLHAKDGLVDKLKATSQCGPFSTRAISIDGERYIDGGTLVSDIDLELIRENPETTFIYVQSSGNEFLVKALLYPCYILAGLAIMRLYSKRIGRQYIKELFIDETQKIRNLSNVIFIQNRMAGSTFMRDKKKLELLYEHGRQEAERKLCSVTERA